MSDCELQLIPYPFNRVSILQKSGLLRWTLLSEASLFYESSPIYSYQWYHSKYFILLFNL